MRDTMPGGQVIIRLNIEKFRHAMMRFRMYNGQKGESITVKEACDQLGIIPKTYYDINNLEHCYAKTADKLVEKLGKQILRPSGAFELTKYREKKKKLLQSN